MKKKSLLSGLCAAALLASALAHHAAAGSFGEFSIDFSAKAVEVPLPAQAENAAPFAYVSGPQEHSGPEGIYYTHHAPANVSQLFGEKKQYVWHPNPGYSGQCATGAEYLAGSLDAAGSWHDAPPAAKNGWTKGELVLGNKKLAPGTLIARGWDKDGHYPNSPAGNHAALYLKQSKTGKTISIYEQAAGRPLSTVSESAQDWAVVTTKLRTDPSSSQSLLRPWGQ